MIRASSVIIGLAAKTMLLANDEAIKKIKQVFFNILRIYKQNVTNYLFVLKNYTSLQYQPLDWFTTLTTNSITGTSIKTPTTVAKAAPE